MLWLIMYSNSLLANCKTKNIKLLHLDVGLCRVSKLFLDILLKTGYLWDLWWQKKWCRKLCYFFSGTPCIYSYVIRKPKLACTVNECASIQASLNERRLYRGLSAERDA